MPDMRLCLPEGIPFVILQKFPVDGGWPWLTHPVPLSSQATSWTTLWPSGTCQSGDAQFL